jgi:hypothetical protein
MTEYYDYNSFKSPKGYLRSPKRVSTIFTTFNVSETSVVSIQNGIYNIMCFSAESKSKKTII